MLIKKVVVSGLHHYTRMVPEESATRIPGVQPLYNEVEEFVVETRSEDGTCTLSFVIEDRPEGFIPGSRFVVEIRPLQEEDA